MSDKSAIEWTDATWSPVTGCTKVSEGCLHCYIERTPPFRMAGRRFEGPKGGEAIGASTGVQLHPERLEQPLHWRKPRRIFVCSLADLFHDDVPDEFIRQVFAVMALAPRHTFQVLTKRPGRMASLMPRLWGDLEVAADEMVDDLPLSLQEKRNYWHLRGAWEGFRTPSKNVWLGTSVETQRWADVRIPKLLETPAAVRFLSCEPLLGPVSLRPEWLRTNHASIAGPVTVHAADRVGWVIAGGESGPRARPMHPEWARSLRDQCVAAGVPFFFKQWGEWAPHHDGIPFYKQTKHRMNLEMRTFFADGSEYDPRQPDGWHRADKAQMWRVGKKRAGRALDGRTWDEMPDRREVIATDRNRA